MLKMVTMLQMSFNGIAEFITKHNLLQQPF